jgi:hypothetical protein
MRKVLLPLIIGILLALSTPVFAEIEIGGSFTPAEFLLLANEEAQALEAFLGAADDFDMIFGFHIGYSWWWLFYASWDAMVMPPWWIYTTTSAGGKSGLYRPGFLNLIDVGVRPTIGPVMILAEAGINNIYIYKQEDLAVSGGELSLGINLRLGAGLLFDWWSIVVTGTAVFAQFDDMVTVLQGVVDQNPKAIRYLINNLIPSISFQMHL